MAGGYEPGFYFLTRETSALLADGKDTRKRKIITQEIKIEPESWTYITFPDGTTVNIGCELLQEALVYYLNTRMIPM